MDLSKAGWFTLTISAAAIFTALQVGALEFLVAPKREKPPVPLPGSLNRVARLLTDHSDELARTPIPTHEGIGTRSEVLRIAGSLLARVQASEARVLGRVHEVEDSITSLARREELRALEEEIGSLNEKDQELDNRLQALHESVKQLEIEDTQLSRKLDSVQDEARLGYGEVQGRLAALARELEERTPIRRIQPSPDVDRPSYDVPPAAPTPSAPSASSSPSLREEIDRAKAELSSPKKPVRLVLQSQTAAAPRTGAVSRRPSQLPVPKEVRKRQDSDPVVTARLDRWKKRKQRIISEYQSLIDYVRTQLKLSRAGRIVGPDSSSAGTPLASPDLSGRQVAGHPGTHGEKTSSSPSTDNRSEEELTPTEEGFLEEGTSLESLSEPWPPRPQDARVEALLGAPAPQSLTGSTVRDWMRARGRLKQMRESRELNATRSILHW